MMMEMTMMAMMMMGMTMMTMGSSNVEATVHYLTRSNASLTCLACFEIIIIGNIKITTGFLFGAASKLMGDFLECLLIHYMVLSPLFPCQYPPGSNTNCYYDDTVTYGWKQA